MSFFRIVEQTPASVAHAVGIGSGVTGLALWAELVKHLTVFAGFLAAGLAVFGALFYAGYWALKMYAKWKRIMKGDFEE